MGTKSPNFPVLSINIIFKASDRFPWPHTVTLHSRNNRQSAFHALIWRTSSRPIKSLQLQLICTFAWETWGQYKHLRSRPISLTNALSFWVVRCQLIMGNALLQTLAAVSGDRIARNRFFLSPRLQYSHAREPYKNVRIRNKIQFDSDSVSRADGPAS